jgi:hypothetical protein
MSRYIPFVDRFWLSLLPFTEIRKLDWKLRPETS